MKKALIIAIALLAGFSSYAQTESWDYLFTYSELSSRAGEDDSGGAWYVSLLEGTTELDSSTTLGFDVAGAGGGDTLTLTT